MNKHSFIIERSSLNKRPVTKQLDVEGTYEYAIQYIAGYIQACKDNNDNTNTTYSIMYHYILENEELS